ncbi:MAG: phosphate/phosphite/phosphonate ABC transporter substrate-binding protein [Myxococcaceae bacterium]
MKPILVGAVIYDPKVAVIWDIIGRYFAAKGCPIDCVYYTNYELMVTALAAGHIDIAWNSPLAWVDAQRRTHDGCRAIAMRDTDRDRVSHLVVPKAKGYRSLADLRKATIATGALDSPQATLIPLQVLRREGLQPGRDFTLKRFDVLVGKHGDHVGGERDALESVKKGEAQACCVLDLNWQLWSTDGTVDGSKFEVLATTPRFDHCNFTVLKSFDAAREKAWTEVLMSMSYDNPDHREMMDLEGLKAWLPGRTTGYATLEEACREQGFFEGR